jgi:hypothetical protein
VLCAASSTIEMLGYSADDLKKSSKFIVFYMVCHGKLGRMAHRSCHVKVEFDETPMSIVNSLDNLQLAGALDNLSKGNKFF